VALIMKNDEQVCQSCCMPLSEAERGTEADGEKSKDYCIYCYKEGEFTKPESTLEMMIDISANIWSEKDPNVTVEQAKAQLAKKLPLLKRLCK
jgi:hypothetical protein